MEIQIHQAPSQIKIKNVQYESLCQKIAADIDLDAESCTVIFVDDATLKEMHGQYLNDLTPTDVMTFDLGEKKIEGEIYISIERAIEQAEFFKVTAEREISRLIIHGILHLKGYDDRTDEDKLIMKREEDRLVDLFAFSF